MKANLEDTHGKTRPFGLAVKAVITDEQGRWLLLRRSRLNRSFVGCWEWPGGKVDPGEDFAAAVVRETREEIGLEVEVTGLYGAMQFEMPALHVVLLCMNACITGGAPRLSEEHDAWDWVLPADLASRPLAGSVGDFMMACAGPRRMG